MDIDLNYCLLYFLIGGASIIHMFTALSVYIQALKYLLFAFSKEVITKHWIEHKAWKQPSCSAYDYNNLNTLCDFMNSESTIYRWT